MQVFRIIAFIQKETKKDVAVRHYQYRMKNIEKKIDLKKRTRYYRRKDSRELYIIIYIIINMLCIFCLCFTCFSMRCENLNYINNIKTTRISMALEYDKENAQLIKVHSKLFSCIKILVSVNTFILHVVMPRDNFDNEHCFNTKNNGDPKRCFDVHLTFKRSKDVESTSKLRLVLTRWKIHPLVWNSLV